MAKKKSNSAAYRLFHTSYPASAPEYYFHTDWDMTVKGVAVTGNAMVDEGRLFRMRDTECYPSFLAMVVGNGGNIQVHHLEDVVAIYEDIIEHLVDWNRYVEFKYGAINNCPLEELKWFEQLARDFHPHVQQYRREHKEHTPMAQRFLGHGKHLTSQPFVEYTPIMERRIRESALSGRTPEKRGMASRFK